MQVGGAKLPSTTPPLPQRKRRGWLAGTGGDWAEGAPLSDPCLGAPGAQSAPLTSGLLPGGPRACPSLPPPPPPGLQHPYQPLPHAPWTDSQGGCPLCPGLPSESGLLAPGDSPPFSIQDTGRRACHYRAGPGCWWGQSRAVHPPLWLRGLGERAPQPEPGGSSVDPALGCGRCSQHP